MDFFFAMNEIWIFATIRCGIFGVVVFLSFLIVEILYESFGQSKTKNIPKKSQKNLSIVQITYIQILENMADTYHFFIDFKAAYDIIARVKYKTL